MAKVRFNLRRNGAKLAHIQMVYRIDADRKKLVMGTRRHVDPKDWDEKAMRVRETKGNVDAVITNQILNKWDNAVNLALQPYKLSGEQPSKIELKKAVESQLTNEGVNRTSSNDFMKHFEDFINRKKQTTVTYETVRQYENAKLHLSEYRKKRMNNVVIEFKDMDRDFFIDFINYLMKTKKQNTVHKIIKKIRAVLNDADDRGIAVNQDYKKKGTQVPYIKQPKIYLSIEEIERIEKCDLVPKSRLDKVRDRLLIGLWTGQRYSDFSRLNESFVTQLDNGKEVFQILNKKTKKMVTIPIKKRIREILDKYNGYPPTISEQRFNEYVKELLQKAGITRKVSRLEDDKQVIYEKWQLATTHICRRSFATNSYKAGLKPKLIMAITGHATQRQFMDYICIDDEEAVEMVIDDPFFK